MPQFVRPSILQTLVRWIYTFSVLILTPLLLLHLWQRARQASSPFYPQFKQRFSRGIPAIEADGWLFHCASVGEVMCVVNVIKQLHQEQPHLPITLSVITTTGMQQARQVLPKHVNVIYTPLDLPWLMGRLLDHVQPTHLVITEVDLWPNHIYQAWCRDIRLFMINARLTVKTHQRMQRLSGLYQPILAMMEQIGVQSEADLALYKTLDVTDNQLCLTHNIKFDLQLNEDDLRTTEQFQQQLQIGTRPVIIAGSTHAPEEKWLLSSFKRILGQLPNCLMIIVPRHPQRFDAVADQIAHAGFNLTRASEQQGPAETTQIFLVDKLGMLKHLYGLANVAFVGGSVAPRGGHNPLEAAAYSVPVLMGPSQFNNREICLALQQQGGLRMINSIESLTDNLHFFLQNPEQAKQAGEQAKKVLEQNRGALSLTIKMLTGPPTSDQPVSSPAQC